MPLPNFALERALDKGGAAPVAGVDEAGRGPLAGPVCAAAVILDPKHLPKGIDDSKRLSASARARLYDEIVGTSLAVALSLGSLAEIERLNILGATLLAMTRAVRALSLPPVHVLIDGRDVPPGLPCAGEAVIGGDTKSLSIAAASIIAKVTRDRLMERLDKIYPAYGFARHAGYGTKAHLAAIQKHGPCPAHRLGFAPFRLATPRLSGASRQV